MITLAEQDEMREFARYFVRREREDLRKMRLGERVEKQISPELPEELPDDTDNASPPRRLE